jgi:hypothetical protein
VAQRTPPEGLNLEDLTHLSPEKRTVEAAKLLDHPPTDPEAFRNAVAEAHDLGADHKDWGYVMKSDGRLDTHYPRELIDQKREIIMQKGGVSREEADRLLDHGILGNVAAPARAPAPIKIEGTDLVQPPPETYQLALRSPTDAERTFAHQRGLASQETLPQVFMGKNRAVSESAGQASTTQLKGVWSTQMNDPVGQSMQLRKLPQELKDLQASSQSKNVGVLRNRDLAQRREGFRNFARKLGKIIDQKKSAQSAAYNTEIQTRTLSRFFNVPSSSEKNAFTVFVENASARNSNGTIEMSAKLGDVEASVSARVIENSSDIRKPVGVLLTAREPSGRFIEMSVEDPALVKAVRDAGRPGTSPDAIKKLLALLVQKRLSPTLIELRNKALAKIRSSTRTISKLEQAKTSSESAAYGFTTSYEMAQAKRSLDDLARQPY